MGRFRSFDTATQSLANPYGLATLPPELYVPIWWYSGSYVYTSGTSTNFLEKGSTSVWTNTGLASTSLFTLNSNWNPSTKYAFEASLWTASSSVVVYAELWDVTANSAVSGSSINTYSTTATVLRSSQFTLVPGHTYAVNIWSTNGSYRVQITDASLIVFPNQQLLAQGSLAALTLGTVGQKLTEAQIPLWVMSSGSATISGSASGVNGIQKGSTGQASVSTPSSAVKLHTLSSSWSPSQKFALEASINTGGSATTANFALIDLTGTPTVVTASTISSNSTTMTVVRSGSFTLTPGHTYGVTGWGNNTSYSFGITKAHLIPLFT